MASVGSTEFILPEGTLKTRLREFGKFRLLVIVSAVLFVTCIVLGILLATSNKKSATAPKDSEQSICDTEECVYSALNVMGQINKAADPCEDFYEFACGGWMRRNPLTTNESSVSGFSVLNDDNMKVLKSALENAATNYSKNSAVMKTAKFYKTCLNTTAIEAKGAAPLLELIAEYGGWSVLNGRASALDLATLMGKVTRELNVNTFLSLSVMVDFEDNTQHIVKLGPARLGMSYANYFQDSADNIRIRTAYKTYMKRIAKLLGGGLDSDAKMMKIYDFEKKLALIAGNKDPDLSLVESLEELRRSRKSLLIDFNEDISDFCSTTEFDESFILEFFNEAFSGVNTFTAYDKIFAYPDWYFEKLGSLYWNDWFSGDLDIYKDYIIWRVVDHYVSAMPSQFIDAKMEYAKAIAGPTTSQRWTDCINGMMTPLDMPLGLLFVDSHFDQDRKETVVDMTKRIRTAFIDNLKNEQWMDQETKDGAKEKALAIKEDIGYPSWIKDTAKLSAVYTQLTMTGNFFGNTRALNAFMRAKDFQQLNTAVNKDKWMNGPAQVNGYYSPQQNRIVFLAGIIQSPFYIASRPRYMNYGGIGMVIGHEVTHGFDSSGRLFDGNGNVRDWWSFSSTINFEERTKCLVKQYSQYKVFGKKINGSQTLNENIADNGGIKLAYDAYQAWVQDNKPEGRLPGLGLSVDQLFFVGFARPWCSIYKREAALLQLRVDSHTFNKYRVIGSLSNFDKFAEAFKCKKGTKMNPSTKCNVW